MIAPTVIVVILTYSQLWDPVECGCSYSACGAGVTVNLKERIKYNDRFLDCSYYPDPEASCPCRGAEEDGANCWRMLRAQEGKCFRGVCYNQQRYESLTTGQRLNTTVPCPAALDYLTGRVRLTLSCAHLSPCTLDLLATLLALGELTHPTSKWGLGALHLNASL
ncbi:uncharacterized protein LOC135375359 isoform X1 [Ornithodoros turicata]|uniref:uncharacterized protein LOC135375359 isoform X1 n=1 Tax=Ornithodoros turicata TaxID=34597 RepID=UPI00313882BC